MYRRLAQSLTNNLTKSAAFRRRLATDPKTEPSSRLGAWVALGLTAIGGVGYWYVTRELQEISDKIGSSSSTHPIKSAADTAPTVIFVLGGPGAGKGTQCNRLVKDFNFVHLSAGDLLREERNRPDSQVGQLINTYIKNGEIVPMEITIKLLKNAMAAASSTNRFLIDGFPRKIDQAEAFEREVVPAKFVLYFSCPEDEMERRLLKRGQSSGRVDDNIESIRKRFVTFRDTSFPVIDKFKAQGKVHEISCLDTPDNVYAKVRMIFNSLFTEE